MANTYLLGLREVFILFEMRLSKALMMCKGLRKTGEPQPRNLTGFLTSFVARFSRLMA